jgi:Polyketide cyclase / dehydrase and lipid transport
MFLYIMLAIAVLIAAFLAFLATRPDTFRVQRAAIINAPPEAIFPLIDDLHSWVAWSPWENKDPTMKRTYGGPATGKGATYAWEGNKDIGMGSMEITATTPPRALSLKLDFIKPFEAHNLVDFTLEPAGGFTNVTWAIHGPVPYFARILHVFMNMDSMIGKDFEAGLTKLKTVAEQQVAV